MTDEQKSDVDGSRVIIRSFKDNSHRELRQIQFLEVILIIILTIEVMNVS